MAEGNKIEQVAEMRSVSPLTVRTQVRDIFSKTGVSSQAELVRLAVSVNLPVDLPPS